LLAGIRSRSAYASVAASAAFFGALVGGYLLMLPAQALGGGLPNIHVTPVNLSFGSAPVGATDDPLNVQVENGGGLTELTMSAPTITGATAGDYSITSDSCAPYPSTLNGSETCTLGVTFQPAAIGARSATLNIPSNSSGESNVEVFLTGEGEFPPIHDAYYPSGPQALVEKGELDGWEPCFTGTYSGTESLTTVLTQCDGDPLLLAGGPTASSTLTVLAAARRADVIFDTGTGNDPHDANGSGWYYNGNLSWGFAKQGDPINRVDCDNLDTPNPELRLCWHTTANALAGGWRAGGEVNLNESDAYTRYVYQAAPGLALGVNPDKRKIEVGENAKFDAKVRNVGFLPASDIDICLQVQNANGALDPANQCKAVGELGPAGRATKTFKVKAKPKAAGKKFELEFTTEGAGLETVAQTTKVIVKPT
jgi:hypothetical protein